MPQPAHLDPSAYSYDAANPGAPGSGAGVLLLHGFTGSVAETRPMGEYLATQGISVRCPLFAGHGTTPADLHHIRWQEWEQEAESALHDLKERCSSVFVGGLSMGALLALQLGARQPGISGLIAMAPPAKPRNRLAPLSLALRHVLKYSPLGPIDDDDLGDPEGAQRIWSYDAVPMWGAGEFVLLQREVVRNLGEVRQPILIFQGKRDAQLAPESATLVHDKVASADRTLVWLEHSGHNLLVDGEREMVWSESYRWMLERIRPGAE